MEEDYSIGLMDLLGPTANLSGQEKKLRAVQEFVRKYPGKYDSSLVAKMKQLGMKRPDWIPKESWTPKRVQFESKGELIARLSAYGVPAEKIAEEMGQALETVKTWLKQPDVKERIYVHQDKIFGGNPRKLFRSALVEAFETELAIMRKEGAKDSVRLNAAQDLMDRASGKAPQDINVNDSNIRTLLERLDKLERIGGVNAIEVPSLNVSDAEYEEVRDNQIEPTQAVPVADALDPVDKWLKENSECLSDSTGRSP